MRKFWAEHKAALPLHYAVYLAEVACKRAAAANVESVFSGAGKLWWGGWRLVQSRSRAWKVRARAGTGS